MKERLEVKGRLLVVLTDINTGKRRVYKSKNIVTNAGDLFYAERGVAQAIPSNFVDGAGAFDGVMELYNGASAAPAKANDRSAMVGLVSGSEKAMTSSYPKLNDADARNTGAGADVITYLASYLTSEANAASIADVILTNPSPGASEALLMHAEFGTPFEKTSADTLDVFINHTITGA